MKSSPTISDTEAVCEQCIWHHDWEGLLRTGACSPHSWAGSVRAELAEGGIFPDVSITATRFVPFPRCAVLMMIKDEADIIEANLHWLYHIGVRRFMVLDNSSTDGTEALLANVREQWADAQLLVLHDPTVEHLQAAKTNAMAKVAMDFWPDLLWLLPVDADEFVIPRHGLQALAYVPGNVDALTIQKTVHFYPQGVAAAEGAVQLPLMSIRSHMFAVPPKVILRASHERHVMSGNHKLVGLSGKQITYANGLRYGFYYREFQTRSFRQFLAKVSNGGKAILAARALGHDVGGEHWLGWYDILQSGGISALQATYQQVAYREPGPGYITDRFHGCAGVTSDTSRR